MDNAERLMRKVIDACTDCDCCRYIMDTSCLFFPEIYKLWDREKETGERITSGELRNLADLCNYCALCPCPDIRENIITAKTLFIDRDGLAPYIRTLEDVERVGKLCGTFPRLSNRLLQAKRTGNLIKKVAGIHPKRKLPLFPMENFAVWAAERKLNETLPVKSGRKIAYFSGCTAKTIFPEVPKAVMEVFNHNRIPVYYPEQNCCGMPSMLEGDRKVTLTFAEKTVSRLAGIAAQGYDIVCSCPTCGYMMKTALLERAYYSKEYQGLVGGDERHLKVPEDLLAKCTVEDRRFRMLSRSIYGEILKDNGYFSGIDPLKRIMVAEHTYDLGEYLLELYRKGELNAPSGTILGKNVYYPPCHLREQKIGTPYLSLLASIPELDISSFPSTHYCCGIAGIMGFKHDFHNASIHMGSRLMAKIKQMDPDVLVTDCLSCRLQFQQMSDYPVRHPIQILNEAYYPT